MNRKFFPGLVIVAVAFTLVLGLGTFDAAKAVPGENGEGYTLAPGQNNLIGGDFAHNSARILWFDADARAFEFAPDTYGLRGTSQE